MLLLASVLPLVLAVCATMIPDTATINRIAKKNLFMMLSSGLFASIRETTRLMVAIVEVVAAGACDSSITILL